MIVEQAAEQRAMQEGENGPQVDPSSMGGQMPSVPSNVRSKLPSGASMPSGASTPTSSAGSNVTPSGREVHPAVAKYPNIVHVNGDDDADS